MKIQPSLSAYLDLLRFIAALSVLVAHIDQDGIDFSWLPLTYLSHEAVIVFFVLSGFIIHHSTTTRQTSASAYAAARLSRIYSVALPAIVVCSSLAFLIEHTGFAKASALSNYREFAWVDVLSSALFLNESWTNSAALTLNSPFWSLCYEVWFYVMFGIFLFVQGAQRWWLLVLVGLIAGPAILALLPIWLMGAWLSASGIWANNWRAPIGWAGFVLPWVAIGLIGFTELDLAVREWVQSVVPGAWRLRSSQRFLTDYVIGALLVLHIASFSSLPEWFRLAISRRQSMLAGLAGFSFTLYLFHRPMTQFVGAIAPSSQGQVLLPVAATLFIVLACWLMSFATEKQLPAWRRVVSRLMLVLKKESKIL